MTTEPRTKREISYYFQVIRTVQILSRVHNLVHHILTSKELQPSKNKKKIQRGVSLKINFWSNYFPTAAISLSFQLFLSLFPTLSLSLSNSFSLSNSAFSLFPTALLSLSSSRKVKILNPTLANCPFMHTLFKRGWPQKVPKDTT